MRVERQEAPDEPGGYCVSREKEPGKPGGGFWRSVVLNLQGLVASNFICDKSWWGRHSCILVCLETYLQRDPDEGVRDAIAVILANSDKIFAK